MSCASSDFVGYFEIKGLPQGADTYIPINFSTGDPLTLVDLSTYSAKLQVRQDYTTPVLIELSSEDSTISLAATSPNITLNFVSTKTENMTIFEDLIYDLEVTSPTGVITRVLNGPFSISRQVTR